MIKNILKCLIIITVLLFSKNVYANENITLDKISEKFNNGTYAKLIKEAGGTVEATNNENSLTISIKTNDLDNKYTYKLNGNIITFVYKDFNEAYIIANLIDSIEQLHGYKEGEISNTINSNEIKKYTLEKEGIEIKINDNEGIIKIDITKKIPLLNLDNDYIKKDDLSGLEEYIKGDGSAYMDKGNIYFYKGGYEGNNTILIAEKNELTNNAYKSLLAVLEIMLNTEKKNEFQKNYPSINDNNEFLGYKIEVNPVKTDFEQKLIPDTYDYKFVRVTVDKNKIMNENIEQDKEENNEQSNTENNEVENPKTGIDIIPIVFSGILFLGLTFYICKKNNVFEY